MRIRAAVGAIVLFANSGAYGGYLTYSQWAASNDNRRAIFLARAIDRLTDVASDAAASKQGKHYRQCILEGAMTNSQLSDNILTFAHSFPDVQKLSAQEVLVQYLNRLCGLLH